MRADLSRMGAPRSAWVIALAFFVAAALIYLVGAGRSYGYDESVTVGGFVATPSLLDPFRRQIVFNNHPLFSFLEHVVWSLGGRTEAWMRVLPGLFAAGSVGIVGWWTTRRRGAIAGLAAAAILASNPLAVAVARSVRGYSLVTLCAIVSTIIAVKLLEDGERRLWSVAYVVAVAAGVATHFYVVLVLVGHVAFIVARGMVSTRWRIRWYLSILFGGSAYLGIVEYMDEARRFRGRSLRLSFPLDTARDILGTQRLAIMSLTVLVVAVAWVDGRRREVLLPTLVVGGLLAVLWLVVAPSDLYPRFLVWLVPGVAVCAGRAAGRWQGAGVVAVVAVVAMVSSQTGSWTRDDRALPKAAAIVDDARAAGRSPCAIGSEALLAYTLPPPDVTYLKDIDSCDVVVVIATGVPAAEALARPGSGFSRVTTLPGTEVVVVSR